MKDILLVVDMQNDFVSGTLGTKEAETIVEKAVNKIKNFKGSVFFTQDTHSASYLNSQEGKLLPIVHCIKNTKGWELVEPIKKLANKNIYEKNSFGSLTLAETLKKLNEEESLSSITLIGICTDICVVSNAILLKTFLPEVKISVDISCCAGTTPENHNHAAAVMRMCQINIENESV